MKNLFPVFFLILFSSCSLYAQLEGNPENFCRNGFFPRESENYFLAYVKARRGEQVHFYADTQKDCPGGKKCRLKSYLINNDEIIVSRKFGDFACAWFQPKKGSETVGWIPLGKLEFVDPAQSESKEVWTGTWRFYDSEIKIAETSKPDVFKVTGNAFWKGTGDNIHIGELDGDAKLVETKLQYGAENADEFDCRAAMRLIGDYLIVSDNLNCGGANVTFSGVYRRQAK